MSKDRKNKEAHHLCLRLKTGLHVARAVFNFIRDKEPSRIESGNLSIDV